MVPGTSLNPRTGVLPFEMFRSFAPMFPDNLRFKAWTPACDIYETDNEVVLKVELPEVKKEEVNVQIENNVLTLRGERKFEEKTQRENYHRVERHYGKFVRRFTLPMFVDATKINAEFKEGVLMVTLPKFEETKPKHMNVKVS